MTDPALLAYRNHVRHSGVYPFKVSHDDGGLRGDASRRGRRNAYVLALESSSDEPRVERAGDDAHPLSADVQRLEARLNVTLELLGRVLEREIELPVAAAVRFNAHGIEWRSDLAYHEGARVLVALHLDTCPALPLELPARIGPMQTPGWHLATFSEMPAAQVEALERLVFRAHRREVAQAAERE